MVILLFIMKDLEGSKKMPSREIESIWTREVKFPEREHDDPNAIRLAAGKSGEVVWKFTNDGVFKIACLVPGHYDAGMHGDVTVATK